MKARTIRCGALLLAALLGSVSSSAQDGESKIDFVNNYIEVKGLARPPLNEKGPEAYPPTKRAAIVEAYRLIAEASRGVQIDSESINDMQRLVSDRVVAAVRTATRSCQVVENDEKLSADYARNGYVSLTCRAPLTGSNGILNAMVDIVAPEARKKIDDQKLPVYVPPPAPAPVPAPARGPAPAPVPAPALAADFDGLILRVPAQFKPSLYPKIRTDKGEVVYSMKDVSLEIQKNRGIASYTNDTGKATASLRALGSANILTVDASLFLDTEAQVKTEDAAKIAGSNKKTSFLNGARVVFVIGRPL